MLKSGKSHTNNNLQAVFKSW